MTELPSALLAAGWQVPALVLGLRALLSIAVLLFLYHVLGEEGESWGGGAAAVVRRGCFALLGAGVFFTLTANWVPEERGPEQGRGFQSYVKGSYFYRLSHAGIGTGLSGPAANPRETALQDLKQAAERVPESAYFRRYLGIVLAERGEYAAALKELNAATARLAERAPDRARLERHLWNQLYGGPKPDRARIRDLGRQVEGLGLGWIGRVAVLAGYRRLGADAAPKELERQITHEASAYFERIMLGMIWPIWLIPQLGLIVLFVGVVLIRTGVVSPAPKRLHPVQPILWESFILYLVLGMAPVLWVFGGKRPAPETQPGFFAALLLVRDVLQLLAVVYLWVRFRARGLSLAEIGLTTRHLGANVLTGFLAALVLLPTAYLVSFMTQAISDRFFPNIAPPYHPLGGLTATSSSGEIRLALYLAAAVGAPVLEEIFFRGALFGALRRRWGFWAGLLGSSAFFAILHPQLPLGFIPIAVLGAAFAALYDWRQSLVPAMVAHAVNNSMAFLMMSLLFPTRG